MEWSQIFISDFRVDENWNTPCMDGQLDLRRWREIEWIGSLVSSHSSPRGKDLLAEFFPCWVAEVGLTLTPILADSWLWQCLFLSSRRKEGLDFDVLFCLALWYIHWLRPQGQKRHGQPNLYWSQVYGPIYFQNWIWSIPHLWMIPWLNTHSIFLFRTILKTKN